MKTVKSLKKIRIGTPYDRIPWIQRALGLPFPLIYQHMLDLAHESLAREVERQMTQEPEVLKWYKTRTNPGSDPRAADAPPRSTE